MLFMDFVFIKEPWNKYVTISTKRLSSKSDLNINNYE